MVINSEIGPLDAANQHICEKLLTEFMTHDDILEYCLHHALNRDPAGLFPIRMPAHPIGDTEQAKRDDALFI